MKRMRKSHYGILSACLVVFLFLSFVSYPWRYSEKMWLHRVNSLEKYDETGVKYPGIEVDIVLRDSGYPDVTHDEDISFGLSPEGYFQKLSATRQHIWLDVKNLTEENAGGWQAWLEENCRKNGIGKERIIVESRNWKTLERFTRNGWYTSCYVDLEKPDRLSAREIRHCTDSLEHIAGSGCVKALSFPYWWYRPLKRYLHSDTDLLTWAHRSSPLELMFTPLGRRMRNDPQLSVILVKEKGSFHR